MNKISFVLMAATLITNVSKLAVAHGDEPSVVLALHNSLHRVENLVAVTVPPTAPAIRFTPPTVVSLTTLLAVARRISACRWISSLCPFSV